MTSNRNRLPAGGRIDRDRPVTFRFDGREYSGYAGDTLASALLAADVRLFGRSFKYHRPRGLLAAGVEEPNALATIGIGGRREPNVPATTVELVSGLVAESQNRWPSLRFDLQGVNEWFSPFLASGFYYKTFMGPGRRAWMVYEHFIRKAAGLGRATLDADPDTHVTRDDFADVVVVGAGPAGLAAARAAALSGARVVLVEQDFALGGALLSEPDAADWLSGALDELRSLPNVRILDRTTAFGLYDGNCLGLAGLSVAGEDGARIRTVTLLHARAIVLATGATERPLVFANNDRPGIMLASACRAYLNRYSVLAGRRVVIGSTGDSAGALALDLARQGVSVLLADSREPGDIDAGLRLRLRDAGVELRERTSLGDTRGRLGVSSVRLDGDGRGEWAACDLVAMSGGRIPAVHLTSHLGARPVYRDDIGAFVPGRQHADHFVAGAVTGEATTQGALVGGHAAGLAAAAKAGHAETSAGALAWRFDDAPTGSSVQTLPLGAAKAFVDFQMDVGLEDIGLAQREGYESVEHLKRYTTLGMGTDQGKTGNINAIRAMATLCGRTVPEAGTTTFRPPYTPVAVGALAGRARGSHFRPTRRTPMHDWHLANGAEMLQVGLWIRPWYYRASGRDVNEAYVNEMRQVRMRAGLMDISTLGKISVQGPDAAVFLDRVYANRFSTLKPGRARYGIMLRDDGIVMDDGTTTCLAEGDYFMTTSTAKAADVLSWMEFLLDTAWRDLRVSLTSVTDEWAGMSVAGPQSRAILRQAFPELDLSNEKLPHMGVAEGRLHGAALRIIRLSYSGERAYEVYVGASRGADAWSHLLDVGAQWGLRAYGTEALGALRIEKGHVASSEIDGRTTLADLGMARMAARKTGYVGEALSRREALVAPGRERLVGLDCIETGKRLRGGAILFAPGAEHCGHGIGRVTSVTFSPELDRHVGLGLLSGLEEGSEVVAVYPLKHEEVRARVVSPVFLDPDGERLNG
jgi:sarcosine oxidase subunit alpha